MRAFLRVAMSVLVSGCCGACSSSSDGAGDGGGASSHGGAAASGGTSTDGVTTAEACAPVDTDCGGDVVGTWKYVSTCGPFPKSDDATGPLADCDDMMIMLTASDVTYIYRADGTYSVSGGALVTDTIRVPKSCLDGQPCPAAENGFTVSDVGDACELASTRMEEASSGSGTYSVSGNTLTDAGNTDKSFCVSGDTLYVGAQDENAMGHLTFKRQ